MKELQLNTLHNEKSFVKHMRAPQPQFSFRSHQRPMKKLTTINDLEPGERALDEDNNDDGNDDNYLDCIFETQLFRIIFSTLKYYKAWHTRFQNLFVEEILKTFALLTNVQQQRDTALKRMADK
uniref:Uncharacterized protein n=1 Tax=Glossina pallidipes TaxID=7398 RepID=A0A1A9Z8A2_GLOPL